MQAIQRIMVLVLWMVAFATIAQSSYAPIGVYVGNPNVSDATAEANFAARYAAFVTSMGQDATNMDIFIDWTQPMNMWVSNANWQAHSLRNSINLGHLPATIVPIISVGLADRPTAFPGGGSYSETVAVAQMNDVAVGSYDSVFSGILNAYKSDGFTTVYFRLGQEQDYGAFPWYATKNTNTATAFVAAFQRVADLAHNLNPSYPNTGMQIKTIWCPADINWTAVGVAANTYPGDQYVDVVGPDAYSPVYPEDLHNWETGGTDPDLTTWAANPVNRRHFWDYPNATQWNPQSSGGWGLLAGIDFALAHNKPFGLSETGAGNNGTTTGPFDESEFPRYLADRLSAAVAQGLQIEFVTIWDINSAGSWCYSDGTRPNEEASWQFFKQTMVEATNTSIMPETDIGSPALAGSFDYENGVFTVIAGGSTIGGTSDQFHYVYQELSGSQTLVARVTGLANTSSFAKAGVMFRKSLAADSAFVIFDVEPNGYVRYLYRLSDGASSGYTGTATSITPSPTTPLWIKLVKSGSSYNGYFATTPYTPGTSDWHGLGSLYSTTLLGSTYDAGLAVTSANTGALTSALFDSVSPFTGGGLPSPKTDLDFNSPALAGSAFYDLGAYTIEGAGSGIGGTSDQFNFVRQDTSGSVSVIARVTGLGTAGGAKAGVMLRKTLAANSAFVMLDVESSGYVRYQFRLSDGAFASYTGTSTGITPSATTPVWLEMTKSGSGYTGYWASTVSTPGPSDWHSIGYVWTSSLLGSTYQAGVAVTSGSASTVTTATVDNLTP